MKELFRTYKYILLIPPVVLIILTGILIVLYNTHPQNGAFFYEIR